MLDSRLRGNDTSKYVCRSRERGNPGFKSESVETDRVPGAESLFQLISMDEPVRATRQSGIQNASVLGAHPASPPPARGRNSKIPPRRGTKGRGLSQGRYRLGTFFFCGLNLFHLLTGGFFCARSHILGLFRDLFLSFHHVLPAAA